MKASELERAKSLARRLQELREFLKPFRSGEAYWEKHASDRMPGNTVALAINMRTITIHDLTDADVKTIIDIVERAEAEQAERVKAAGIEYDL